MAMWGNYFSQLLNAHELNDARQASIHTEEPVVTKPSAFEFELAIGKLRNHKPPGIYQTQSELMKAEGRTFCCAIHKLLFLFGIRRNCLKNGRSRS